VVWACAWEEVWSRAVCDGSGGIFEDSRCGRARGLMEE
jgi:hypothetical protein